MPVATIMKSFLPGKQLARGKLSIYHLLRSSSMKQKRGRTNAIESAAEKRQMQYYIERGNNIETPNQMYDAMCKATALSGFTANVLDIKERKSYAKTKKIKNIYLENSAC